MRFISFLLLMVSSLCYGQSFEIIGDEQICTSPHSYQYSVLTSEIGYTHSWYLLGKKIGEGNDITVQVANVTSFELVLESELNGVVIRTTKSLVSIKTPEIVPIESFSLCPGDEKTIISKEKFSAPITEYLWYQGKTLLINDQSLTIKEGGDYSIVFGNKQCKSDSLSFHVEETEVSLTELYFDIEYGEFVNLQMSSDIWSTFNVSLEQVGGDQVEGSQGQFFIEQSGEYEVNFLSKDLSCEFTYDEVLTIDVNKPLTIPSAFTPNGDGENDLWNIAGLSFHENSTVTIYSRWGVIVHQILATKSDVVWDGKHTEEQVPIGTYYYTIELSNDFSNVIKGDVSVFY